MVPIYHIRLQVTAIAKALLESYHPVIACMNKMQVSVTVLVIKIVFPNGFLCLRDYFNTNCLLGNQFNVWYGSLLVFIHSTLFNISHQKMTTEKHIDQRILNDL
jgi:hypothetical protein